ncbi:hypothetical protein [Candidatus Palauibacter sp.]|uniref:hypothetical protein n=1 Tax=Candidatus Palauibacter sp. TaxID=3101350 RepID=UPI003B5979E1
MDDAQMPPAIEVTIEEGWQGHGEDGLHPMGNEKIEVTTEGQPGGGVATPNDEEVLDWIKERLIKLIAADRIASTEKEQAARLLKRIAEKELEGTWSAKDRSFLWFVTHRGGISDEVSTAALRIIARASTLLAELALEKRTPVD